MNIFNRGSASVTAEVDVSAAEFWALLRNWPAVMSWEPLDPETAPLLDVTLKEGDNIDILPCTRVMHFDVSKGFPPTFEETLLYAYPEARRIFYTFNGIPGGLTNYMATTYVDELGDARARVTCASMFDVPSEQSVDDVILWLEAVYEGQIIRGIEAAIKRDRNLTAEGRTQ